MQPAGRDATVAVVRCDGYGRDEIDTAVRRAVDLLGGTGRFVSPGQRILLKPNLLQGQEPERCVTTHPAVVA
ncbi:MAG: Thylakoid associated protein, partial [Methanoculleus sp.]|nr:Thylakoid associated protein [Methanoculleus sp.]